MADGGVTVEGSYSGSSGCLEVAINSLSASVSSRFITVYARFINEYKLYRRFLRDT